MAGAAEHVTMLIASLEWEPTTDTSGFDELRLAGIDREAAAELVEERSGRPVLPHTLDQLMEATGGNPLGLCELSVGLRETRPGGLEPDAEQLPPATAVERAFLRRVEGLSAQTRDGLVVVAADSGVTRTVLAACARLNLPANCLEPAEEAGVIRVERSRIGFVHPLLRAAVYHAAPAATRNRTHRALADVLAEEAAPTAKGGLLGPGAGMRRAWQLAAAAHEPDEAVASALEAGACEARSRSGYAAAAAALERAARLTPFADKRAARLVASARDWHLAGRLDAAAALLDEAVGLARDSRTRAPIQHLRGRIDRRAGLVVGHRIKGRVGVQQLVDQLAHCGAQLGVAHARHVDAA